MRAVLCPRAMLVQSHALRRGFPRRPLAVSPLDGAVLSHLILYPSRRVGNSEGFDIIFHRVITEFIARATLGAPTSCNPLMVLARSSNPLCGVALYPSFLFGIPIKRDDGLNRERQRKSRGIYPAVAGGSVERCLFARRQMSGRRFFRPPLNFTEGTNGRRFRGELSLLHHSCL